ncbi:MAG: hypothetical protein ACM359_12865, partial [Bacillota bacterium]
AEPFVGIIPFDLLSGIAKECPGTLVIESGKLKEEPAVVIRHFEKTRKTTNIEAGVMESEFKLFTRPAEDFPAAEKMDGEPVIRAKVADLVDALNWVLPALDDHSRYGLIFRQDEGHITLGATNGYVLATYGGIPAELPRTAKKPLVIPWKVADRLLDVLEREMKLGPDAMLEVRIKEGEGEETDAWCFSGECWHMNATTEKVEFPAAAWDLLQREDTTYGTAKVEAFRKAFKEVAAALKNTEKPTVTIAFTNKGLVLSSKSAGSSEVVRPVGGACRGIAQSIRVTVENLKDWLKALPKNDWIGLAAIEMSEPAVFLCRSKPQARWIVAGHKEDTNPKTQATAAAQEAA